MIVLMVGPRCNPITGQAKCYNFLLENTKHDVVNIFSNAGGRFYFIKYIILVFYHRLFSSYDAIYFTSSRSKLGFLRDFILVLLNYGKGCFIVNHLHGADFKPFRDKSNFIFRCLIDFVYNRVNSSIVLTNGMKSQYSDYPSMKLEVVSNFFDSQEIGCLRDYCIGQKMEVLFLSNLIDTKGYKELVEAVTKLNCIEKDSCTLHLAGAALGSDAKKFLSELKADKNIKYHGVVSGQKKVELLSKAHVVALPTSYPTEAQPLCLIEGMASGCYILTTDHNYIPEFIDERNGTIVKLNDTINYNKNKSLFEALVAIIKNRGELRDVMENNMEYSKNEFSSLVYIKKIDDILEVKK